LFFNFLTDRDKEIVAEFLITCTKQENIALKTKRVYLVALARLAKYFENEKSFDVKTADDLFEYMNSMYKDQKIDPK